MSTLRLRSKTRVLVGAFVILLVLGGGALAFACTALATLDIAPGQAAPGQPVDVVGKGFSYNPVLYGPVEVRFNGPNGPVVYSGRPAVLSDGFEFSMSVPDVAPGYYTFIATQYDLFGKPRAGTPARGVLQVIN